MKLYLILGIFLYICINQGLTVEVVGDFKSYQHGISGQVEIVDNSTLRIKNFKYDGQGPDAFFYIGTGSKPIEGGVRIPYPSGDDVLKKFTGQDITLKIPQNIELSKVKWLSVWCRKFSVNFGDIYFNLKNDHPSTNNENSDSNDVSSNQKISNILFTLSTLVLLKLF